MRPPARIALVLGLSTALALGGMSIASADKTPPVIPSQQQVDQAAAQAQAKQRSLEQIQADLVAANAKVLEASQQADQAAEEYNGALWRLDEAQKAHDAASAAATQAKADVAAQREGIAVLVADSYQRGGDLNSTSALLSKEGPEGIVNRLSVAKSANDSMNVRFEAFKVASAKADRAESKANKAEQEQKSLADQAKSARDRAATAAVAAERYTHELDAQKQQLAEEVAKSQNISVDLAKQRQVGLERQAAEQAAAAEKARQLAALKAAQEAAAKAAAAKAAQTKSKTSASDSPTPVVPTPTVVSTPPPVGQGVDAVLNYARAQLGLPYRWGAAGPSSFDCSGLTMMAWRAAGKSLPHYSAAQYSASTPIARSALQPGDLVFWGSSPGSIHHVALYIGNGQILHAPRSGQPVQIASIDYWIPPSYFGRP